MITAYSTKIIEKEVVAKDTLLVSFERPNTFSFKAGQHIQLAVKKLNHPDPKGSSRTFSICSSPSNKESISVVFRETGSGFKKTLSQLPIGKSVLVEGPLGFFSLPDLPNSHHVFVAGGIGIAPFLSMIKQSTDSGSQSNIDLVYANHDENSAAFLEELQELSKRSNVLSLDLIYGRVEQRHLVSYVNKKSSDLHWWVVGPPDMVTDVKYMIQSLEVWEDKIHTEEFIGY